MMINKRSPTTTYFAGFGSLAMGVNKEHRLLVWDRARLQNRIGSKVIIFSIIYVDVPREEKCHSDALLYY